MKKKNSEEIFKKKPNLCFVAVVAFVIRCVVLNNPKDIGSYIDFRSEFFFFTKFLLDKFSGAITFKTNLSTAISLECYKSNDVHPPLKFSLPALSVHSS